MLKAMNIDMNPVDIKSKNVAAVVVTAKFAPFARQGDAFDVVVSSIGDAKSLEGGTLLMTPLKGVDGKIYALAQGSISIGGKNEKGSCAESHPTVGMVYGGGLVEREINQDLYHQQSATLSLKSSNFANSVAIQNAIRSEEHTSELQSQFHLVCRLLLDKPMPMVGIETPLVISPARTLGLHSRPIA